MSKREKLLEFINDDIYLFDKKYDEALIGYVNRITDDLQVLYDKSKLFELFKFEALKFKPKHLYFTKSTFEEIKKIDDGNLIVFSEDENTALIGYAENLEGNRFVIYDEGKFIEILTDENLEYVKNENPGFSEGEIVEEARKMAIDYFDFNIIGAYFGKRTPGFATILDDEE